jgi:hypothetical protein
LRSKQGETMGRKGVSKHMPKKYRGCESAGHHQGAAQPSRGTNVGLDSDANINFGQLQSVQRIPQCSDGISSQLVRSAIVHMIFTLRSSLPEFKPKFCS